MLLNLFFTPLIVKNLDSESYGLQSLVNVIIGFLMVADMGLDIPVTKSVAEYKSKKESDRLNELLNSTMAIYLLIGFLGLIIIGLAAPFLAEYVFKIPEAMRQKAIYVFYLAGIGFVGGLFSMWGKSVFNGLLRYDISNGINVVSNLLSLLIGTWLVVEGYGVVIYVLVRVAFTFLSGFAYFFIGIKLLDSFKVSLKITKNVWDMLKSQIGYGFLLRISGMITSRLDQILIGIWIGVAAVGYYAVPLLIITSLSGLLNSMTHYLFPQMSELNSAGKDTELKTLFFKASRYIGILCFIIYTPFIILGSKFLHVWVGDPLASNSSNVFLLLILASIISTLFATLINLYVVAVGKLDLFTKYILIRSSTLGILMFFLIKPLGLTGIGISMIVASLFDGVFYLYILKKYIKVNVSALFTNLYLKLAFISILAGLFIRYTIFNYIHNMFLLLLTGLLYATVFLILIFLLRVLNDEEKGMITVMKHKLIRKYD